MGTLSLRTCRGTVRQIDPLSPPRTCGPWDHDTGSRMVPLAGPGPVRRGVLRRRRVRSVAIRGPGRGTWGEPSPEDVSSPGVEGRTAHESHPATVGDHRNSPVSSVVLGPPKFQVDPSLEPLETPSHPRPLPETCTQRVGDDYGRATVQTICSSADPCGLTGPEPLCHPLSCSGSVPQGPILPPWIPRSKYAGSGLG